MWSSLSSWRRSSPGARKHKSSGASAVDQTAAPDAERSPLRRGCLRRDPAACRGSRRQAAIVAPVLLCVGHERRERGDEGRLETADRQVAKHPRVQLRCTCTTSLSGNTAAAAAATAARLLLLLPLTLRSAKRQVVVASFTHSFGDVTPSSSRALFLLGLSAEASRRQVLDPQLQPRERRDPAAAEHSVARAGPRGAAPPGSEATGRASGACTPARRERTGHVPGRAISKPTNHVLRRACRLEHVEQRLEADAAAIGGGLRAAP